MSQCVYLILLWSLRAPHALVSSITSLSLLSWVPLDIPQPETLPEIPIRSGSWESLNPIVFSLIVLHDFTPPPNASTWNCNLKKTSNLALNTTACGADAACPRCRCSGSSVPMLRVLGADAVGQLWSFSERLSLNLCCFTCKVRLIILIKDIGSVMQMQNVVASFP